MRVRDSEDMSTTTAVSNADGRDDGTATFAGLCAALDLLDAGVLLLSSDLRVTYANARWTRWVGTPLVAGTPLAALVEEAARDRLSLLVDTLADGQPRTLQLWLCPVRADAPSHHLTCTARRTAMHGLVLEALPDDDDASSLHDVARRLAEVSDMAEVLHTLCEIAAMRCRGTAAAVLRTTGQLSEVVAASGDLLPARGRCFELDGSMVQEAFEQNTIVSESNYNSAGRPLQRVVPELALGPVLVAPLRAHGDTLGVLAVARAIGAPPFAEQDAERLRMLADHAALAVHKSMLLQQAQSADRAKGRFLATMSHELRTPLTALAGYNELLSDQVMGPMTEPQLDVVERMRSVTTHLSAMIEEILAFTSLEEGREMVRPSEFLAEDLVRAAAAVIEPLAIQKGLKLDVVLPRGSVRMSSDIDKARQLLVNLLGNAVKFTDAGTVTLQLSRSGHSVRADITDTGIGIPADELPRLFRPFAQVDTGLTRRHGGTGLGLYISRRLATMLGGHIEVSSTVGKGSTFSVVLPVTVEAR
jgi:signal transduction histidine kinase